MEFLVSIPIRTEDAQNVIDAFITKRPYNAPVPAETVADNAGNSIPNPIKESFKLKVTFWSAAVGWFVKGSTGKAANLAASNKATFSAALAEAS